MAEELKEYMAGGFNCGHEVGREHCGYQEENGEWVKSLRS